MLPLNHKIFFIFFRQNPVPLSKNDISLIEANHRAVKDSELWEFLKVLALKFEELTEDIENKL